MTSNCNYFQKVKIFKLKLRPFEFLMASDHTMVLRKYCLGEILPVCLFLDSAKMLLENFKNCVTVMCCNDGLNWLFTNRFRATRCMKVKRMGKTEILRRIRLFSASKIKVLNLVLKNQLNSALGKIIFTQESKLIFDIRPENLTLNKN